MFLILIILIIGAVYWFREQDQHTSYGSDQARGTSGSSNDPIEILRQRFARGEIDEVEFKERKNVLEQC